MEMYEFIFALDKQRHFFVTCFLLVVIFLWRVHLGLHKNYGYALSFTIRDVFLIGICKEIIDIFGFGNPELFDILANSLGIFVPLYAFFLIKAMNTIRGEKLFLYENDLIKYTFRTFYREYVGLKTMLEDILRKSIFRQIGISQNRIKSDMYECKRGILGIKKSLYYFSLMQIVWTINTIKFFCKIPIIALFGTFGLIFSPLYLWKKDSDEIELHNFF